MPRVLPVPDDSERCRSTNGFEIKDTYRCDRPRGHYGPHGVTLHGQNYEEHYEWRR